MGAERTQHMKDTKEKPMSHAKPVRYESRRYSDGTYHAGDLVIADVRNPFENPHSRSKHRPLVLVCRIDGHWCGMGLTTNPRHVDGAPRVAVPHPAAVGLRGAGYLWGDRLTSVSVLDIGRVIGRVDLPLANAVLNLAGLKGETVTKLHLAARGGASASARDIQVATPHAAARPCR